MKRRIIPLHLDSIPINCPDCGTRLLITEAHVPTTNSVSRNKVEVEGLCLGKCGQYKHLSINFPGKVIGIKGEKVRYSYQRALAKITAIKPADLRIVHPACGFFLKSARLSIFSRDRIGVVGICTHCNGKEVALFYSSTEQLDLEKDNFWITCPDCRYDVFLDKLSERGANRNPALVAQGTCSFACGPKKFVLEIPSRVPLILPAAV